jgi:geranylgeranyl diphosphate synthase, type II
MTEAQFERHHASLRSMANRRLASLVRRGDPVELNEGCAYVLEGGGKRIRSSLVMLACEAVGGRPRAALDAGAAVEIMHNFTLVHDDIMDHAATRRGKPTVHERWNLNTALLVGDVLLGLAYRTLLKTRTRQMETVANLFTAGVLEVCEGQALDMEFEKRLDVTVDEYFRMIEKKTGRLISLATEIGGLIGGARARHRLALRRFGHHLGRAFQLQDDLLDVVAVESEFGKTIGGDIAVGKRTYLLLTAASRATGADRNLLIEVLRCGARGSDGPDTARIAAVRDVYERTGTLRDARILVERNTRAALRALQHLPDNRGTLTLHWLSNVLLHRSS